MVVAAAVALLLLLLLLLLFLVAYSELLNIAGAGDSNLKGEFFFSRFFDAETLRLTCRQKETKGDKRRHVSSNSEGDRKAQGLGFRV